MQKLSELVNNNEFNPKKVGEILGSTPIYLPQPSLEECSRVVVILPGDGDTDNYFVNVLKDSVYFTTNDKSEHVYNVISGNGTFLVKDGESIELREVQDGEEIIIKPGLSYSYYGEMCLAEKMTPGFSVSPDREIMTADEALKFAPEMKSGIVR